MRHDLGQELWDMAPSTRMERMRRGYRSWTAPGLLGELVKSRYVRRGPGGEAGHYIVLSTLACRFAKRSHVAMNAFPLRPRFELY